MLKVQIQKDLKEAFQKKETEKVSVLRLLLNAIKNKEIEKRAKLAKTEPVEKLAELSQLTDEEINQVIMSEVKKRKEAIAEAEKFNRPEIAEKEKRELEILKRYLPEQLNEEEIRKLVKETIKKTNAQGEKDLGRVMGVLMPQIKGRAEGSVVNRIVREELM